MKKLLCGIICFLLVTAVKAQFAVAGGDTIDVNGTTSPTQPISGYDGSCRNTGPDTITLTWEIIKDSTTPGWTYTGFCDKNNCYDFALNQKRSFTLAPGTSGAFALDITQGCVAGTGYVQFLLWNAADSASTVQLVTFAVTITPGPDCPTAINEVADNALDIYPNPAYNQLKIALTANIGSGRIDVYNLLGAKVVSQAVDVNETVQSLDITSLESGFYIAVISDGNKFVAAKKFSKLD